MLVVVMIFGAFLVGIGLWGISAPAGLVALTERFLKGQGLWIAVAIRIGLAIALWFAAPNSYTPGVFRFFAAVAFFAALVLPVLGQAFLDSFVGWWTSQPGWLIRMTCLCVVTFGAFLAWSAAGGLTTA